MERLERRSKKEEVKEKKKSRKFELTLMLGGQNQKKEVVDDDDVSVSPRDVFGVPISGTDSDSTGSSNYGGGPGSPGLGQNQAAQAQSQQWRAMIDVLRFKSVRRFSTIPLLAASYEISRKSLRNKLARIRPANEDDDFDGGINIDGISTKPSWRNFSYADLAVATDDFSPGMNQRETKHALLFFCFLFSTCALLIS